MVMEAPVAIATPETPDPPRRSVASNAGIYLASQIVSWCVAFLSISIIPRILGEKAIGQLSAVGAAIQVVSGLLVFGTDTYLTKEVGRERERADGPINTVIGLRLALILPATVLYLAAVATMKPDAMMWRIAFVFIAATHFALMSQAMRAVLSGFELAVKVSLSDLILAASPLLAIPFLSYGPIPLVWATLGAQALLVFLQLRWIRQRVPLRPAFDAHKFAQAARGGAPFFINTYILPLYGASAIFLLKRFVANGDETVGVWSQSGKLMGTFLFVPTAVSAALLPAMSRLAAVDREQFQSMGRRVLSMLVVIGLPVSVLVFMLAHPLTVLLYRDRFAMLPPVLQVMAFNIIPLYVVSTMYQFLVAQGRAHIWSVFLASTAVANFMFGIVLIPMAVRSVHNGAVGAAVANVLAEIGSAICALWLLKMNPFDRQTAGRTLRSMVAAALMVAAMWLTRRWFLVIPAAAGVITFAVAGWALRILMPDEQAKLSSLLKRLMGRLGLARA